MHSERLNEKQSFEDIFVELFLTLVNNIAESTLFETTELTELRPRFPSLILVPLMGFASTLLSLLTALLVFINQPLARILTALNGFILEVSLGLVDFFSRMPLASKRVATPTIPELLPIYGILILAPT